MLMQMQIGRMSRPSGTVNGRAALSAAKWVPLVLKPPMPPARLEIELRGVGRRVLRSPGPPRRCVSGRSGPPNPHDSPYQLLHSWSRSPRSGMMGV